MEKKIKLTDNPNFGKTVYGIIIAVLCITAIVIGIIAANNQTSPTIENPPSDSGDPSTPPPDENEPNTPPEDIPDKKPEKKSFLAPVSGTVAKPHSMTVPVFSATLEAWKIHTGIDISTDESAEVFAAFDGTVEKVYADAMLGTTVVIDHGEGVKSYYSNLSSDVKVSAGATVAAGELIGCVGDSSISELADEPHLHFEIKASDISCDPLEYFSDESKSSSLGISAE